MHIENLSSYRIGSRFDADLVVIGGGPAGLTIAREFMNSATRVLILESTALKAMVSLEALRQ
jgi:ribulose 1,5-bisphosphate synthetase/thiazole synthase